MRMLLVDKKKKNFNFVKNLKAKEQKAKKNKKKKKNAERKDGGWWWWEDDAQFKFRFLRKCNVLTTAWNRMSNDAGLGAVKIPIY